MAYTSPRRQESAAATRQAILAAATRLFLDRGYAATTIADIAVAATVAPATVYTSVGGKPKVLEAICQPPADDPELARLIAHMEAAGDPREAIRRAAKATRYSAETNADVFAVVTLNAPFDPVVAKAAAEMETGFRQGAHRLVTHLRELGALSRVTRNEVDTVVYFLGHASWRQAVGDLGWTYDRAQRWLADRLAQVLLG